MWAIHRLNGVVCTINSMSSVSELRFFLKLSACGAIFTCRSLLATTLRAANSYGIPKSRIFVIEDSVPSEPTLSQHEPEILTLEDLITLGRNVPSLQSTKWSNGEGGSRAAFLSWSSGTSGIPVKTMHTFHFWNFALLSHNRKPSYYLIRTSSRKYSKFAHLKARAGML